MSKAALVAVAAGGIVLALAAIFFARSESFDSVADVLEHAEQIAGQQVKIRGRAHDVTDLPLTGKHVFLLRDDTDEIFVLSEHQQPAEGSPVVVVGRVRTFKLPLVDWTINVHVEAESVTRR